MKTEKIQFAFFGTPDRAVMTLDALNDAGLLPSLIITQPDRPQGRKMVITPPPAKIWAEAHNIPVLQPEKLNDDNFIQTLKEGNFDVFVVVAYGKIISQTILDISKHGALNLHASFLPRLRGASPIESALLTDERKTGVTIMLMDHLMDHGPILGQKEITLPQWPLPVQELAKILVTEGGKMLADILPKWIKGHIKPIEQDHSKATLTKKIKKEDGLIDLSADGYQNFLKFNAYKEWPGSFFFIKKDGKDTRIIITEAAFENNQFVVKKVIPEGKKEMVWTGATE